MKHETSCSRQIVLRFGIPTLDQLLGHPRVDVKGDNIVSDEHCGVGINSLDPSGQTKQDAVSVCLIGVDGVGKSTLAMHMAAQYRADVNALPRDGGTDFDPLVLYASTDLTFGRADVSWRNFGLNHCPDRIRDPFDIDHVLEQFQRRPDEPAISLREQRPLDQEISQPERSCVYFLDLATHTTGDDWGYINRLIGSLDPPEPDQPKHMMIVDAVEGLEVLVGEIDAYGQHRDRRSRVAQLIRTAAEKCHLVFLVEANEEGKKTPEEFIADAVVRLGSRADGGYQKRFVQVEKVRAQAHVPGPHAIVIRDGRGSTTGESFNADDPPVIAAIHRGNVQPFVLDQGDVDAKTRRVAQSYVYVFHSLNLINRVIMKARGSRIESPHPPLAGFGIENLDGILERRKRVPGESFLGDERGISSAGPVALIGEDQTYKSKLAKAFLAQAKLRSSDQTKGVAVLITTKTLERAGLIARLERHLGERIHPDDQHRVLCRRLEVHTQSAESLYHLISQAVKRAQATLLLEIDRTGQPADAKSWQDEETRRKMGWRIRLVIDNWTSIRDMYPQVQQDPLFLPCLMFFLRREGIATIIVGNEDRGFTARLALKATRRLRELTATQLFTWRVPYFGESRVAITVTPQQNKGQGSFIRELKVFADPKFSGGSFVRPAHLKVGESWKVAVSRSFELYEGLEKGVDPPRYVPLRVHLYAGSGAAKVYFDDIRFLFERMTNANPGDHPVICDENPDDYERLREFTELQGVARYPYTLVLQVDEFWSRSQSLQLHDQRGYLRAMTAEVKYARDDTQEPFAVQKVYDFITEDPFHLYQPTAANHAEDIETLQSTDKVEELKPFQRASFFSCTGYDLSKVVENNLRVQKVPYAWDFGFLMVNRCAWRESHPSEWEKFQTVNRPTAHGFEWADFAESCVQVAEARNRVNSSEHRYVPFAVAPEIQETVSCAFLEILGSEIDRNRSQSIEKINSWLAGGNASIDHVFPKSREKQSVWNLAEIMETFADEASRTLLIMAALLPPEVMTDDNLAKPQNAGNDIPVACRTWFSAAQSTQEIRRVPDVYVPARLPGSRSVRGDWFLATARGSRSYQMGARAIDLLTSRRGNILRLQNGVGLPVRDVVGSEQQELWTPLWHHNDANRRTDKVTYHELKQLGQCEGFSWIWRSRIKQYDHHARLLRRWICSTLRRSETLLAGEDPLTAYRDNKTNSFTPSIQAFIQSLGRATISEDLRYDSK